MPIICPTRSRNVLCSLQKFDQGTLGWPTAPRKRYVWTKKMYRSPPEVPLAGTGSSLILNSRHFRSMYSESVDKISTLYQILQASPYEPSCKKSARRRRIARRSEFNLEDDRFYNDRFDIVGTHLQFDWHPNPEENKPQRYDSPIVRPPVKEIYKVRPRDTETTTPQKPSKGKKSKRKSSKAKFSIVESNKHEEKINEQRADKGKSPKSKSQHSRKYIFQRRQRGKVQERIKGDPKKSLKFQHKSPKVQNNQENTKESSQSQHKSPTIEDYPEKNSMGQHNQDSSKEPTTPRQISPTHWLPITEFSKAEKSPSLLRNDFFLNTPIVNRILTKQINNFTYKRKPRDNVTEEKAKKATGLMEIIINEPANPTKLGISKSESTEKNGNASRLSLRNVKSRLMSEHEIIHDEDETPCETLRPSYMQKLKQNLNRQSWGESRKSESFSVDLEAIQDLRDLLLFPYNDIFKKSRVTEVKDTGVQNKKNKPNPKRKQAEIEVPLEMETEGKDAIKKKSSCYMCRRIRRPGKEAPFLEEMRKQQRRQELMAYRANMAMWNRPSKGANRTGQLGINNLDRKLYSLDDKYIVLTKERNLTTLPKESNSTIFPTPSKSITVLKRSNSFILPKESSLITFS